MNAHVDTRELKDFAKVLRREVPEVGKRLRRQLREAGKIIADDAQERANGAMSNPPKVKVRVTGMRSVSVVAAATVQGPDGPDPIPGLLEEGNKGSGGGGTFRHPVFGNDVYVDQPMKPFLKPAFESRAEEAIAAVAVALDETVEAIAFGRAEAD